MLPENRGFPREILEEIRLRADIAAIISERVTLKRAGASLKGLCPFHQEKTPSFHVNAARGFYKCFGCGEGGDVFTFVMKVDGLEFGEAVRALSERTGVKLPDRRKADPNLTIRELARELLNRSVDYFQKFLLSKKGKTALSVLKSRKIDDESIMKYRLGLAPPDRFTLYNNCRNRYPEAVLDASGLFARGERGRCDRFHGRLIFPVCDASGRVVALGGRLLEGDGPKYINSPETEIFRKGEVLYGLHQARDAVRRAERAVLVEGYVDVVLCHQSGIGEAVAPLGTAFTEAQARLVRRFADRVIFALDADAAGAKGAERGIDVALGAGLEVRVATFAGGLDPADLVTAGRADEITAAVDAAVEYVSWRLDAAAAASEADGATPAARSKAARTLVPTLSRIEDPIARAAHVRAVAERLGLDEEVVRREVDRATAARSAEAGAAVRTAAAPQASSSEPSSAMGEAPTLDAETSILRICLDGPPEVRRLVGAVLVPGDFAEEARGRVFAAILAASSAGEPLAGDLGGRIDESGLGLLAAVSTAPSAPPATVEEAAARIERVKERALEDEIRAAGARGDLERAAEAARAKQGLKERVATAVREIRGAGN